MATETDETYFRKYLDDPEQVVSQPPTGSNAIQSTETSDTEYYRKYLNDRA